MKVVLYVLAALVGALGLIFVAGSQGQASRLVVGAVLVAAAIAMVIAARLAPRVEQRNIVQRIDFGPDVKLEQLKCRECGAALPKDAVSVLHGAALVSCPYCSAAYQLEEEPRW